MIGLASILLAAASQPPVKPVAVQAVELCTEVARPAAFNLDPLAAAGWTEGEIKNIEQAPGGAEGNRLFIREGAGAVIMLNIDPKKGGHYCHVLTSGPSASTFKPSLVATLKQSL